MRFPTYLPWLTLVVLITSACGDTIDHRMHRASEAGAAAVDPQAVVDQALEAHGSHMLDRAEVQFEFRDRRYTITRFDGLYSYERTYEDSTGASIREVMTNDALYREVDGRRVELADRARRSLESSLNSVAYFALLPYKLNDPAVQKRYLGESIVDGEPYHKIEVTFRQEGGGRDFQDRFVYWFHQKHHTMDYLAYLFHTSGGGTRFRVAVDPRTVGGVRFADYLNFTSDTLETAVERYDEIPREALRLVSEIRLENLRVRPLTSDPSPLAAGSSR